MNTRNVTNTAFTSYPATGVELPNGRQLANTYDALYRRTLVQDVTNTVNVAAWQFFGPGRVAEVTLGNGLICSWLDNARTNSAVQPSVTNPAWGNQSSDRLGYDGAGRPITKRYLAGGINGSTGAYNKSSAVVGFTTEYDLSSNKFYERHLHCPERSHLYEPFSNGAPTGGYDSVNRLRQYQRGTLTSNDGFAGNGGGSVATPITLPNTDTQRTYDLDSLGNWRRTVFTPEGGSPETEIRQHNGLNEITRIQNGASQTNLSYDGTAGHSNGNLANDGTRTYQWDALNRLLQVNRVSDGAIIGQYVYDALNRRIRKTVSNGGLSGTIPNGTTDSVYSGWRCVEERNPFGGGGSTDTPTAQYIWGIYLDECLQQRLLVATNNFAANSDLYPLQDLLYRTTGLADSSGTVREAYDTDAYGNTLVFRNAGTPPAAIAWTDSDTQVGFPTCPFIFTGQRFDPETTLYYYKRRFYLPSLGKFISRDPLRYANEENLYGYIHAAPTSAIDPLGLKPPPGFYEQWEVTNANTMITARTEFWTTQAWEFRNKKDPNQTSRKIVRVVERCTVVVSLSHFGRAEGAMMYVQDKMFGQGCGAGMQGAIACWASDLNNGSPGLIPGFPVMNGIVGNASVADEQGPRGPGIFAARKHFSMAAEDFNAGKGPGQAPWKSLVDSSWNAAVKAGEQMVTRQQTTTYGEKTPCCPTVNVIFVCDASKEQRMAVAPFNERQQTGFCGRVLTLTSDHNGTISRKETKNNFIDTNIPAPPPVPGS